MADTRHSDHVDILGVGSSPSDGFYHGSVMNIEAAQKNMWQAMEQAEAMSGIQIGPVYVGISAPHIRCVNSHGVVSIHNREVTKRDVRKAWDAARAQPTSADRETLHVILQKYKVDTTETLKPLGMSGSRLEVGTHIITGSTSSTQDVVKCANLCGMDVMMLMATPLAAAEAVLTLDERNHGACVLNIDRDITGMTIFSQGSVEHTSVLAVEQMSQLSETVNRLPRNIQTVVLTGDPSVTSDRIEWAVSTFNRSVRIGRPQQGMGGLVDKVANPAFAASVGLVLYASRYHQTDTGEEGWMHTLLNKLRGLWLV
ncbi:MAG: cell division protein FtsA [Magnetococcales bacterium]|nr:cell division protein FtsA [Magnetococcales bacterium]